MRQPILLAASLLACLAAPPVWAADPDFLAAGPPPMPRAALADPGAEEPEHARRPWELAVRGAAASPGCLGGALLGCDDLGAGGAWGASVVYRLTPLVGLGAEVTRASLRGEGGGGVATALGARVRGWFAERGAVDPWVEVGWGGGALDLDRGDAGSGATRALTTGVGAGLDAWIGRHAKLGAFVAADAWVVRSTRACAQSACGAPVGGEVVSMMRAGVALTVALGPEM